MQHDHVRLQLTRIEIVIALAATAALVLVAVNGVHERRLWARAAEARNALGVIAKDAATAYANESPWNDGARVVWRHALCRSASASVPAAGVAAVRGKAYASTPSEWEVDAPTRSGFACLRYAMDEPQYYVYSYTAVGSFEMGDSFTAVANGDLDGDGRTSTFALTGTVTSGESLHIGPQIIETNAYE